MDCIDKYTLTWQNYSDHLREALKEMKTSSAFADVTLVTDDKQQIRAHRNILSACSPVFKSIFQIDSKNANPVIYLRGIQYSEMESIMQFIYLGEARFYDERMREFLQVSNDLEIKDLLYGLDMNNQPNKNIQHDGNVADNDHTSDDPSQTFNEVDTNVKHQTHTLSKPCKPNKVSRTIEGSKYSCNVCDKQYSDQSNLGKHIRSVHKGVKYACNQCNQQFTQQNNLTTHIKSKHEGVKYACNQCNYQAGYISHLTTHIQSKHEGVTYNCNQCNYQATQQGHLTIHTKRKHL